MTIKRDLQVKSPVKSQSLVITLTEAGWSQLTRTSFNARYGQLQVMVILAWRIIGGERDAP
jgi:hypothetical protein